jgi:7-keto-8-aminopelargonate synthetase-like enzyme
MVEFPAVAKGAARFRLQVMAKHSSENIADAGPLLRMALHDARLENEARTALQVSAA